MKTILTPVEDERAQAQLALALQTAELFAGHIDGLAPRTLVEATVYGEGFATTIQEWERQEDARTEGAAKAFRAFMQERGVAWGEPGDREEPSANWISDIERGPSAVGQLARLYDVTVMTRPAADASGGYYQLLETILFESGRPMLMAPPEPTTTTLGRTVVIAWNGSTESARAITLARPFLDRAEQVHVLSIEGGMVAGPKAEQVQTSLRRLGIASQTRVVGQEGRSTGEAILEETAKLGGDLLVKGAYTHSRLRQMIFGGATSHILREATLPVFMAH